MALVCVCSAIYALIPKEWTREIEGWKQNLVTMETSLASGIASTYGYSVAGGIPGGLLAEFAVKHMGRNASSELEPLIGEIAAKTMVTFVCFVITAVLFEFLAICAYAFAHQHKPPKLHAD